MHSPSWQPTLCVAWCLIWWFESLEKYGHTWHQMSFLRPGVIKQHQPRPKHIISYGLRWRGFSVDCYLFWYSAQTWNIYFPSIGSMTSDEMEEKGRRMWPSLFKVHGFTMLHIFYVFSIQCRCEIYILQVLAQGHRMEEPGTWCLNKHIFISSECVYSQGICMFGIRGTLLMHISGTSSRSQGEIEEKRAWFLSGPYHGCIRCKCRWK